MRSRRFELFQAVANSKFSDFHHFSDLSKKAVALCKKNAKRNKIKIHARVGSMYKPWEGKKFDLVIESISAIAKKVAVISPWYKNGIPCDCGEDGTALRKRLVNGQRHMI